MTETIKPAQAKYVPAGLYARQFMSDSSLYVRHLPLSSHRTTISFEEKGKDHVILRLYDRDVHVVRNTHRLFDEDFDIQFNNSVFGADNYFHREFGVDRILMSAHNGLHELKRDRKDRWMPTHPDVKVLGDSGGFQLRLGTTPYIDPHDVIDWMNDFVDIGASLDIVPRVPDEGDNRLLFGMAEAQRKCNDIFLSKAREGLEFMNVVHGFNSRDARMWCDRVKSNNPAFIGWASGMDSSSSFVNNLATAMLPMLEFGDYQGKKGLHFFGISGKTTIPILVWLARVSGVPITMDSTNYLKGNRFRLFYFLDTKGKLVDIPMGRSAKLGYRTELPCNCPVCQAIKWCEAFNLEGGAKMQHMLTIHNLITTLRFVQRWNAIAANTTEEGYRNTIKGIYPKDTSSGILESLDFVNLCLKDGADKALKEYHGKEIELDDTQDLMKKMEPLFPGEGPKSSHEDKPSMIGQKFLDSSSRILYRYIPKKEVNTLWAEEKKRRYKAKSLKKKGK